MNAHRKLLVLGLNELLVKKLVSLDDPGDSPEKDGYVFADIAGQPSVIRRSCISGGELEFSIWWKYDHSQHPQANLSGNSREEFRSSKPLAKSQHFPKFVGALASGWLERRTGKWLQGRDSQGLFSLYARRGVRSCLDEMPVPRPSGFEAQGKLFR